MDVKPPVGRALRAPRTGGRWASSADQAAFSHMAVSNALLINGMFMPKLLLAAVFGAGLAGLSATLGAPSVARSHEPDSWERATEKNRST